MALLRNARKRIVPASRDDHAAQFFDYRRSGRAPRLFGLPVTGTPNIYMSPTRETAFFCNDGLYNRGAAFYETTFFHEWSAQRTVGEKTPEYLLYPGTAARIRRLLPEARMIVTVRSPAERAHSNWRHNLMFGWESLPFREALDAEPDRIAANKNAIGRFGYLARGNYRRQLDEYYAEFGREQVHIIFFGDLIADQAATLARPSSRRR
jgi:hypothetical protein